MSEHTIPDLDRDEFIREWITALRSGDYRQGTGALIRRGHDHDRLHCCLGVACDILAKREIEGYYWKNYDAGGIFMTPDDERSGSLPGELFEALGVMDNGAFRFATTDPEELVRAEVVEGEDPEIAVLLAYEAPSSLIELNDQRGWSFDKIADAIEYMTTPGAKIVFVKPYIGYNG